MLQPVSGSALHTHNASRRITHQLPEALLGDDVAKIAESLGNR
jgi:hypothetical protein